MKLVKTQVQRFYLRWWQQHSGFWRKRGSAENPFKKHNKIFPALPAQAEKFENFC